MKKSIIKNFTKVATILALSLVFIACPSVKVPEGVNVVDNFDIQSYAGKWYEIARFDFKHEKDMDQVTAEYSLNNDGSVRVLNKGYDTIKQEWKEVEGKAKFIGEVNKAALKVSFFGPFYSGYNVIAIDPDYKNALVFGENTDYIWFLSREKTMSDSVKNNFLKIAKDHGYNLDRLVWTKQDQK